MFENWYDDLTYNTTKFILLLPWFFLIGAIICSFFYNLWRYLYENKLKYEFHHLVLVFYHQSMIKIFY